MSVVYAATNTTLKMGNRYRKSHQEYRLRIFPLTGSARSVLRKRNFSLRFEVW